MQLQEVVEGNAIITAEATVAEILLASKKSICQQKILVTGYGCCGKPIAFLLRAMGAEVTVAARREKVREEIRQDGFEAVEFLSIHEMVEEVDTIVNTVPALVITEEIIEKQRLQRERDYDLLTGLLTRRAFYQKMDTLYRRPNDIKHAVLMMCDLDGLKQFNDKYGHANGDKAIQKAAEILASVRARNKYISRLSGDEFAIFIYGEESDGALEVKIRELYDYMMQAEIMVFNQEVPVRLSGGYIFYSKYPESLDKLLKKADRGLYDSKEAGRARFTEYKEA